MGSSGIRQARKPSLTKGERWPHADPAGGGESLLPREGGGGWTEGPESRGYVPSGSLLVSGMGHKRLGGGVLLADCCSYPEGFPEPGGFRSPLSGM